MQAPLEIRYAGVVITRAPEVRTVDGESTLFLPGKDPLPVGTVVRLRSGERETPARVLRAVESADPSLAGMQVRLIGEAEEVAADWIPAPAPVPAKATPKPGTPTPTVEVDIALMQEAARTPPAAPPAESAAVPEAVPVAVGSSLTGALEQAAQGAPEPAAGTTPPSDSTAAAAEAKDLDIIITDTPTPVTIAAPAEAPPTSATAPAEASSPPAGEAPAGSEASGENGEEEATADAGTASEDMPTARPIAGPSGRRKTKRRRYQHA